MLDNCQGLRWCHPSWQSLLWRGSCVLQWGLCLHRLWQNWSASTCSIQCKMYKTNLFKLLNILYKICNFGILKINLSFKGSKDLWILTWPAWVAMPHSTCCHVAMFPVPAWYSCCGCRWCCFLHRRWFRCWRCVPASPLVMVQCCRYQQCRGWGRSSPPLSGPHPSHQLSSASWQRSLENYIKSKLWPRSSPSQQWQCCFVVLTEC